MKKQNVKYASTFGKFSSNKTSKKDAKKIKGGIIIEDVMV